MLSKFAVPVAILLIVLGIWESAVHLFEIPRYILPAPSKIVVTLFAKHAQLLKHTLVTLEEMLLGFREAFQRTPTGNTSDYYYPTQHLLSQDPAT